MQCLIWGSMWCADVSVSSTVSCPGWLWCVEAPGASGGPCPACWHREAAGWLSSPGAKMLPAPPWHLYMEVRWSVWVSHCCSQVLFVLLGVFTCVLQQCKQHEIWAMSQMRTSLQLSWSCHKLFSLKCWRNTMLAACHKHPVELTRSSAATLYWFHALVL